jgi:tRNA (guanine37-N1)-methyltransferase
MYDRKEDAMKIEILTLFPDMCKTVLETSILGRGIKKGALTVTCRDIRTYAGNTQNRVDDYPYGGGPGIVIRAEPLAACCEASFKEFPEKPHLIYMSPQGKTLTQERVRSLAKLEGLCILCGHYEGIDERFIDEFAPEEISLGDYVLTGGELPALALTDAIARMLPGVLSQEACFTEESHYSGLLEHPHYTRPAVWRGRAVPEVLISGHHANIIKWRAQQALERTKMKRPDIFKSNRTQKVKDFSEIE